MDKVWLSQLSFDSMVEEAASKLPTESGGILLGYWVSPGEAVIAQAIGPGPNAVHTATSFYPDGEYHWAEIEKEFSKTGGRHTYLGDWHSHPAGGKNLSMLDYLTLGKIARTPESQNTSPLMLILHGGDSWEGAVWRWNQQSWKRVVFRKRLIPMKLIKY